MKQCNECGMYFEENRPPCGESVCQKCCEKCNTYDQGGACEWLEEE